MTSPTNSTPSIPQLSAEEIERWKTRQILNVSKLGKVFNQFPTRLLK